MASDDHRRRLLLIILPLALSGACSSSTPEPNGGNTMGGGSGSTATSAGAGQGGTSPVGGTGSAGGGSAGASAGMQSTSGAPAGGASGVTSGGAGGGSGGSSGQSASGAGGSGGAAQDPNPRMAAQVLDGFTLLKPCKSWNPSGNANNQGDCCCEETPETENQHVTKQFGGDASLTYDVKVRIAGVAERYWYEGGQLDAASKLFYTGGLPTIHSDKAPNTNLGPGQGACKIHPPQTDDQFKLPFTVPPEINPKDGCFNGFNIFAMVVSTPKGKQAYYLNFTTDYDNVDRQPHAVYKNDYTVTISIPGQAALEFYTIDGDHHQVTNNGTMQLPNLKTQQPYNGNFLEFTVVDVTVKK